MKAQVKILGPGNARRWLQITHRNRVTFREGEWLETLIYLDGGPFKLVNDEGLPVWCTSRPAPHVMRFDPWAVARGFRMRRLA